jgi:hypothetical protein
MMPAPAFQVRPIDNHKQPRPSPPPGKIVVSAVILNRFWMQVAVSRLKPAHGGFRSETAVTQPFRK